LGITAFRQQALLVLVLVLVLLVLLPEQSMIDSLLEPSQQQVLAQSAGHSMLELSESFQLV
jgi:hypothetical protein